MKLEDFDDYMPNDAAAQNRGESIPADSVEGAPLDDHPSDDPTPPRRHTLRKALIWCAVIVTVVLAAIAWLRYFNPYVEDAKVTGYITSVERRGIIFKTFEGQMITNESLTDTTRVYSRDFAFSVPDDSLARTIQSWQGTGRPVTLTYKRYYGSLPWRGASLTVATAITPANMP